MAKPGIGKMTYTGMRCAFGNGNLRRGRQIMEIVALRLEHARQKHPIYAQGKYHALGVIHSEFRELEHAVEHESPARQFDEALDVIATAVRFLNGEHALGDANG